MRSEEVKKRNLAITSMSAMLLATVAISMITTTDNAFASNEMYSSGFIQAAAASSSETGTSQETCEECFDVLSSDEQDNLVEEVGREFPENPPMTLEEFCAALGTLNEEELENTVDDINFNLAEMGIDEATQESIDRCLITAFA